MPRLPKRLVLPLTLILLLGLSTVSWAQPPNIMGRIKLILLARDEFILTDRNGKQLTFWLPRDGRIVLNGKESKLNDLKEGDDLDVFFKDDGKRLIATEVRCTRK